jgi:OOP family OmpA-OmpF porin
MRKLLSTLAVAALLSGAVTQAHATEGWYGRADAGYSFDGDLDVDTAADSFDLEDSWMAGLGFGYAMQNSGWRFEGELSYRDNDLESNPPILDDGDISAWAAMLNAYYDFNKGGRFEPYVGLGVGAARLEGNAVFNGVNDEFDTDDTVLAYQGIVGVAIGLGERWDLDIAYRYFAAPDAEFDGFQDTVVPTTLAMWRRRAAATATAAASAAAAATSAASDDVPGV